MMSQEREQPSVPLTLAAVVSLAVETTLRDGGHPPTLIADGSQQSAGLQLTALGATHEARAGQVFMAGYRLAKSGRVGTLKQTFLISEAWMSVAASDKPPSTPPSQDPQRKEILSIACLNVPEDELHLVVLEMVRDGTGDLVELKPFEPSQEQGIQAESPLLAAFVEGFRVGRSGRPG